MNQTIEILGEEYNIIDVMNHITVADSFVFKHNKIGRGNGEAKLYIGQEGTNFHHFWGNLNTPINCFILKTDLIDFLNQTKAEYINPIQEYRESDNRALLFNQLYTEVNQLEGSLLHFKAFRSKVNPPRVYINSQDANYSWLRNLGIPNLSYLSVMSLSKLKTKENIFYFKLFKDSTSDLDKVTTEQINLSLNNNTESSENFTTIKKALQNIRVGQHTYRQKLLKECPFCPFTNVDEPKLLIASHIKPWAKSSNKERLDHKNGFIFTPTYDALFDKGLITFTNDKKLIVSKWLSNSNKKQLNLSDGMLIEQLPLDKKRKEYLDFHRKFVFKN